MSKKTICPICLSEGKKVESHHVIWRSHGGTNHRSNILKICKTCHAVITSGDDWDAWGRQVPCVWNQFAEHGLLFAIQYAKSIEDEEIDLKSTLHKNILELGRREVDKILRQTGRLEYIVSMRDLHSIPEPFGFRKPPQLIQLTLPLNF